MIDYTDNMNLLILDDDKNILQAYQDILQPQMEEAEGEIKSSRSRKPAESPKSPAKHNYTLHLASTGEEAVDIIREHLDNGQRIAAGFFDVKLGKGIDGIETIRQAREIDQDLICSIVTAYQDRNIEDIRNVFNTEDDHWWDYLNKPFTEDEIRQKARNMLSAWNRQQRERLYIEEIREKNSQLLVSEKHATIGKLSRSIAHEFGNILQGIMGKADIAQLKGNNDDMKSSLNFIIDVSTSAKYLLGNLQNFSRSEPETLESFNLATPVNTAVSLCEHLFKKKSITFNKKLPDSEIEIRGFKNQLMQVFLNMLMNSIFAIDSMDSDGGSIDLVVNHNDQEAEIRFKDTGCGMDDETAQHLFEPLFTTKGTQGCGLGMSIVKNIIENGHRGTISFESAPGKGTTFIIKIPRNTA